MKIETTYTLGDRLRDKVTGISGIALGITKYATGCIHYGICPEKANEKGEIPDWIWLDGSRVSLEDESAIEFPSIHLGDAPTSGPGDDAPACN